jgi:hypothetical protein
MDKYKISDRWDNRQPLKNFDATKREVTDEEKAYWKKVQEPVKFDFDNILSSITSKGRTVTPYPLVTFDNINNAFVKCCENELGDNFKAMPGFIKVGFDLAKYFTCTSETLDPSKGILLYGEVGTGKSETMRIYRILLSEIERRLRNAGETFTPRGYKIRSCIEIVEQMKASKSSEAIVEYFDGNMMFDDVGYEDTQTKIYGNENNFMQTILSARYDRFKSSGIITHLTSNYTPEQLGQMYGIRIADRIHVMFNFIEMKGASFRR